MATNCDVPRQIEVLHGSEEMQFAKGKAQKLNTFVDLAVEYLSLPWNTPDSRGIQLYRARGRGGARRVAAAAATAASRELWPSGGTPGPTCPGTKYPVR